jgi:DNA-binding transcriptional ArsR family regulator
MPDQPFLLVSLKEDKAKKLAQVIGNPTCTKILDYLAGKDATETQIAQDLGIPLSTVHYNMQQLVQAKLVVIEEFHYSPKGREVNHYKLANKFIIIAPKDDPRFLDRLKKLLPATVVTLGLAAALKTMEFFTGTLPAPAMPEAALYAAPAMDAMNVAADAAADSSAGAAAKVGGEESARSMVAMMQENVSQNASEMPADALFATAPAPMPDPSVVPPHMPWWQSPMVDWFLIGAGCVLLTLVLWEFLMWLREKRGRQ